MSPELRRETFLKLRSGTRQVLARQILRNADEDEVETFVSSAFARDQLGHHSVKVPEGLEVWTRGRNDAGELKKRDRVSKYLLLLDILLPKIKHDYARPNELGRGGMCIPRRIPPEVLELINETIEQIEPNSPKPDEGEQVNTELFLAAEVDDLIDFGEQTEGGAARQAHRDAFDAELIERASVPYQEREGLLALHQHTAQRAEGDRWVSNGITIQNVPKRVREALMYRPTPREDLENCLQDHDIDACHPTILRHFAPDVHAPTVDRYLSSFEEKKAMRKTIAAALVTSIPDDRERASEAKRRLTALFYGCGLEALIEGMWAWPEWFETLHDEAAKIRRRAAVALAVSVGSGHEDFLSELSYKVRVEETKAADASIAWLEANGRRCSTRMHDGHYVRGAPMTADDELLREAYVQQKTGLPVRWEVRSCW